MAAEAMMRLEVTGMSDAPSFLPGGSVDGTCLGAVDWIWAASLGLELQNSPKETLPFASSSVLGERVGTEWVHEKGHGSKTLS